MLLKQNKHHPIVYSNTRDKLSYDLKSAHKKKRHIIKRGGKGDYVHQNQKETSARWVYNRFLYFDKLVLTVYLMYILTSYQALQAQTQSLFIYGVHIHTHSQQISVN